jgi:hypothetical protein
VGDDFHVLKFVEYVFNAPVKGWGSAHPLEEFGRWPNG